MSRIPRETARAIDRLARAAHAFHRFAHHPLCDEYADEVVRVGSRRRLCRGCSFVAIGAGVGALVQVPLQLALLLLAAAWILVAARPRDRSKLLPRLLPAAFAASAVVSGLRAASLPGAGIALAGLVVAALAVVRYRSRGPDRSPCASCSERDLSLPCRGYAAIVRRERAFQRVVASRFRLGELGP